MFLLETNKKGKSCIWSLWFDAP